MKFIVVGILCTIVNYLVFFVLLDFLHWHYLLSSGTGFFSGVLVGYFFNRAWTFQIEDKSKTLLIKYSFVYICSLIISLAFLRLSVGVLGVNAKIANVIAIGITTCTNFSGIKFWAFGKRVKS
ncbi:MAG: GtrA family protein [bacterium]|nr:GtrA family protein [bacterium]